MSVLKTSLADIASCVAQTEKLSKLLPNSVPEGTAQDRLYLAVTTVNEPRPYETFNRIFDRLFKEDSDCRDENGRFKYMRRGKLGITKMVQYLKNVDWSEKSMASSYALVKLRLDRLNRELEFLAVKAGKKPAKSAPKNKKTDSTTSKPNRKKKTPSIAKLLVPDPKSDDSSSNSSDDDDFEPEESGRAASEEPITEYTVDDDGVEIISGNEEPRKRKRLTTSGGSVDVIDVDSGDEGEEQPQAKKRKKGPSSTTREYFRTPTPIVERKKKRWAFRCKLCKSVYTVSRTVDGSKTFDDEPKQPVLGNLATHLRERHPTRDDPPSDLPQQPGASRGISDASESIMSKFLENGKINPRVERTPKGFNRVFAAWILEDDLPFTTGETAGIARLFDYMESRFKLPSDTTVRNYLDHIFSEMRTQVKEEIRNVKSRIACSNDTWTTKSMMYSFAGTIACWITDDWHLLERVVDFQPIADKGHQGEYAAQGFAQAMSDMGVLDKITLTLDNASSNNTLIATLSKILIQKCDIQFVSENSQIRCLNHVTNITVQKIMATLDEDVDPEIEDHFDKSIPAHYSPENDKDQLALENEEDLEGDEEEEEDEVSKKFDKLLTTEAQVKKLTPVKKLRTVCTKITSSPQRRSKFRDDACRAYKEEKTPDGKSKVANLMVVKDVTTRWNYTHAMVKRGRILRKAIERWIHAHQDLWGLTLSDAEWILLGHLESLLEPFTEVTLQMSKSDEPTLPWVIPMYEFMILHLSSYVDDNSNPSELRRAAKAGLDKLEVYYEKARKCHFNIIATILHPGLGYAYFQKLGSNRASEALTIFTHAYGTYKSKEPAQPTQPTPAEHSQRSSFLDKVRMAHVTLPTSSTTSAPVATELERFLKVEGQGNDGLTWWKLHEAEFPIVAKMARDFLAIPATSTSVERLFSKSRQLCADLRSSLQAPTIMKALLSKLWIKSGLFKVK